MCIRGVKMPSPSSSGPLKPTRKAKLSLEEMVARMREIGSPADGVQEREPFEYPDRPGLFD